MSPPAPRILHSVMGWRFCILWKNRRCQPRRAHGKGHHCAGQQMEQALFHHRCRLFPEKMASAPQGTLRGKGVPLADSFIMLPGRTAGVLFRLHHSKNLAL